MKLHDLLKINPCRISENGNGFVLHANPKSDTIRSFGKSGKESASFYYMERTGDFTVKARVYTNTLGVYNAGFLMVRQDKEHWIKLCVECSNENMFNVVSVITETYSDDANGELLPQNNAWLRITRKGDIWGLHYSLDGKKWRFVRTFGMKLSPVLQVGFGVQCPKGDTCESIIESVSVSDIPVSDFRSGE